MISLTTRKQRILDFNTEKLSVQSAGSQWDRSYNWQKYHIATSPLLAKKFETPCKIFYGMINIEKRLSSFILHA